MKIKNLIIALMFTLFCFQSGETIAQITVNFTPQSSPQIEGFITLYNTVTPLNPTDPTFGQPHGNCLALSNGNKIYVHFRLKQTVDDLTNMVVTRSINGVPNPGWAPLFTPNHVNGQIVFCDGASLIGDVLNVSVGEYPITTPGTYIFTITCAAKGTNFTATSKPITVTLAPGVEVCSNGIDDNCNGLVDENTVTVSTSPTGTVVLPSSGSLVITATTSAPSPSFTWTNSSGTIVGHLASLTVTAIGTFKVVVKSFNCKAHTTVTVTH